MSRRGAPKALPPDFLQLPSSQSPSLDGCAELASSTASWLELSNFDMDDLGFDDEREYM